MHDLHVENTIFQIQISRFSLLKEKAFRFLGNLHGFDAPQNRQKAAICRALPKMLKRGLQKLVSRAIISTTAKERRKQRSGAGL